MLYYFGRLLALMLVGRMTLICYRLLRGKNTHTHRHVIRTDNIEFDCSDYDAVGRDRPHSISFAPEWMEKGEERKEELDKWRTVVLFLVFIFIFVFSQWYKVNVEALEPEAAELFLQLDWADAETQVFLERCQERSDAVFTQLFHLVARTLLAPSVSQTSINGYVKRTCIPTYFSLFFLIFLFCVWHILLRYDPALFFFFFFFLSRSDNNERTNKLEQQGRRKII